MMQIGAARQWLIQALVESESARLDADVLLCKALDCSRTTLMTWPERELPAAAWAQLQQWCRRRQAGEPIAHLIGEREFWSLPLAVNSATLIPRPDTEVLVELALELLPSEATPILDLGTGTGAIALALKSERPDCSVWAVDRIEAAAELARHNSQQLDLPIEVRVGSWFAPLHDAPAFGMIVSNPPYIDNADPHLDQGDVRFEPKSALVAEESGLSDLRQIIDEAPRHLCVGGWLLLEHGWQQAAEVRQLLLERGFSQVATRRDYGDNERVTYGCWEVA